jgi:23S rRNA pseudouridine2457 synthase
MPSVSPPLYALNKPYGVLSQFTARDGNPGLATLISLPGYRPIGRLDHDSEGLLLLSDDKSLITRLASPKTHVAKRYLVQVEGEPTAQALEALRRGPRLSDGPTRPARVERVDEPAWLWPRDPPIRQRRHIPTSWLTLEITEGRNRQVRRMTAAVGVPTLRLIRVAVGPFELDALAPGALRAISREALARGLPWKSTS